MNDIHLNVHLFVSPSLVQYLPDAIGMGPSIRRHDSVAPIAKLTPEALRVQHEKPFEMKGLRAPAISTSTTTSTNNLTPISAKSQSKPSSTRNDAHSLSPTLSMSKSAATLPILSKPIPAQPSSQPDVDHSDTFQHLSSQSIMLQHAYSQPNLMKVLKEQQQQRTKAASDLVHSFHSHHVSAY